MDILVTTDGSARPNPGIGKIGYILIDVQKRQILKSVVKLMGRNITCNTAEFTAMAEALEAALKYNPDRVVALTDSTLVVGAACKNWHIQAQHLIPLSRRVKKLKRSFKQIKMVWQSRDYKYIQMVHDLVERRQP